MRLRDVRLMFEVRDLWCGVFWDRGWIGSTVDRADRERESGEG